MALAVSSPVFETLGERSRPSRCSSLATKLGEVECETRLEIKWSSNDVSFDLVSSHLVSSHL